MMACMSCLLFYFIAGYYYYYYKKMQIYLCKEQKAIQPSQTEKIYEKVKQIVALAKCALNYFNQNTTKIQNKLII